MRRRPLVLLLVVGLAGLTWPSPARAARLVYQAPAEAAHRCPSRTRFAEEVSARLGFSPWSRGGRTLRIRIEAADAGFAGRIAPPRARPKVFAADSCRKVADLLVTATAIALDRLDPPDGDAPERPERRDRRGGGGSPQLDGLAEKTLAIWSFAPRNNLLQLGGVFVTDGGFGLTGDVPIGRGHLQAAAARTSSDSDFGDSSRTQVHGYYLWPVFYLNEDSAFEVPIFAGGGLAYHRYAYDQSVVTAMDTEESKIVPTLLVGHGLQFRGFPVEIAFQMTLALVEPPLASSRLGFNLAMKYVFGRAR